ARVSCQPVPPARRGRGGDSPHISPLLSTDREPRRAIRRPRRRGVRRRRGHQGAGGPPARIPLGGVATLVWMVALPTTNHERRTTNHQPPTTNHQHDKLS